MAMLNSRVVRILVYEGNPVWIGGTLSKSAIPLIGVKKIFSEGTITSLVVETSNMNCLRCNNLTTNPDLLCDECQSYLKELSDIKDWTKGTDRV